MMPRRRIRWRQQAAAAEKAENSRKHNQLRQNFFHTFSPSGCVRKQQALTSSTGMLEQQSAACGAAASFPWPFTDKKRRAAAVQERRCAAAAAGGTAAQAPSLLVPALAPEEEADNNSSRSRGPQQPAPQTPSSFFS